MHLIKHGLIRLRIAETVDGSLRRLSLPHDIHDRGEYHPEHGSLRSSRAVQGNPHRLLDACIGVIKEIGGYGKYGRRPLLQRLFVSIILRKHNHIPEEFHPAHLFYEGL